VTKSRAFAAKSGQNISSSVEVTKSRAFAAKYGKNISSSVGVTKSRAFAAKSGQNISSSVGVTKSKAFAAKSGLIISSSAEETKSRAFAAKSGQNCAILLSRHNLFRALPENYLISIDWYYWKHTRYSCGNHTRFKTCYFKTLLFKVKAKTIFGFG
jgi:hypothetical protein